MCQAELCILDSGISKGVSWQPFGGTPAVTRESRAVADTDTPRTCMHRAVLKSPPSSADLRKLVPACCRNRRPCVAARSFSAQNIMVGLMQPILYTLLHRLSKLPLVPDCGPFEVVLCF